MKLADKKKKLLMLAASGALVLGAAAPAIAETRNVSGGTWDYGTGAGRVWSDYHQPDVCHGSSVQGKWYDSDTAEAGYWSKASAPDRRFSRDRSYYKSRC